MKPGIRISGGQWRGRKVHAPLGLEPTRPTPGVVREALFSILGPEILSGPFCDLYGGTGAVAFEAVSRGAPRAVVVERDAIALACVRRSIEEFKTDSIEVIQADAARFQRRAVFQVVFADPPFGAIPEGLLDRCLQLVRPGGWAVLQWPSDRPAQWPESVQVRKYGASQLILSRKPQDSTGEAA
ncbi:MAG: RsmD family RNA methyltransferase [Fibrobacteria bacterium]|nr:RsmD family RNA methyltransferase [Fibrobacteria bacterium]